MKYEPFDQRTEVRGAAVLSVVDALDFGQSQRLQLLEKHGLNDVSEDSWHPQSAWLSAFGELSEIPGASHMLFAIGKKIPYGAAASATRGKSLKEILGGIQAAYVSNHRYGDIGSYEILEMDLDRKRLLFRCRNPYPSEFDFGLVSEFARLAPENVVVRRDPSQPSRLRGDDHCVFNLRW